MARRKGPQPAPLTDSRIALAKGIESAIRYNQARNRKPRSIDELAEMSGLGRSTIYNMRNMSKSPEIGNIDKVAMTLGVKAWALLYVEADADLWYVMESYRLSDEEGRRFLRRAARTVRPDSGNESGSERSNTAFDRNDGDPR